MDVKRRTALIAGTLFITGTAAVLLGTAIERPASLSGTADLTRISAHMTQVSAGGLLELLAAAASAGIAVALYPVLRRWSGTLALGAVVFRTIEAAMYTLAAVSMLSLAKVAHGFTQATAAERGSFQALGDSLLAVRREAILAGVFAFALGGLMYYSVFYRSRLVPRWLSGWGIVGELLMLGTCLSALFSGNAVTSYTTLVLPIAVQEIVLAVWLIGKGFRPASHRPGTVAGLSAAS
jgi:hypothetical protein